MKKHFLLFLLCICIFVCFISLLQKEKKVKEYNSLENFELAIYLNDEETNKIPSKEGNIYDETKSGCTNGAYIIWDYESWSPVVKNMNEHKTKCELYFKTGYKESILNGMDPVLEEPLIPVTIENDGTVKKADVGNEWYSYENKEWANAVILFDKSKDYLAGEVIPESEIESYFVWIPKYRYQLWDLGLYNNYMETDNSKVHKIPIIFGDYNTNDSVDGECTTPMESGATGNCAIGDYMTHPAFLSIPSTGFWLGKFETGYRGATSTREAEQNINDSSKIIVKPNAYSWRGIQLANAFYTSYNYKRELDSHMIKNTEWGAVAYLQHSAYGSAISVRINNNSDYITGYQANNEPTCGTYNSPNIDCNIQCNDESCNTAYPNSVLSSTTGNITGIYDMSGGSWDYSMGIMMDEEGNPMSGYNLEQNSGFNGTLGDTTEILTNGYNWPDSKYYDLYIYNEELYTYSMRILGDATGEMGPVENVLTEWDYTVPIGSWYTDRARTVFLTSPFYVRGGNIEYGNTAGIFNFSDINGRVTSYISFRLILTPTGGTS